MRFPLIGGWDEDPVWAKVYPLIVEHPALGAPLWRLGLEPKRLWRRYVVLNPAYLARLGAQKAKLWDATPPAPAPADERPPTFSV